MQSFIVFAVCLGVAVAAPGGILAPGLAPLAYTAAVAPGLTSSQYHAQDELGQYSYGYAGGPSSKSETRTADGITRGAYSYLDANGLVQNVQYVSDPVNGFRVAATNLPVGPAAVPAAIPLAAAPAPLAYAAHPAPLAYAAAPVHVAAAAGGPVHVAALPLPPADTPEVSLAKAQHYAAHVEARARA